MSIIQRIKPDYAIKIISQLEELCKLALIDDFGLTADQVALRDAKTLA